MKSKALSDHEWLVVFDTGDELIAAMTRFVDEHGVRGGSFQAIGGFERATIAWWSWDDKKYEEIACDEQVEVLSLLGNVSSHADRRVHSHVILGKRGSGTLGGHLLRGIVRPTVELILTAFDEPIDRELDRVSGLQMIRIP